MKKIKLSLAALTLFAAFVFTSCNNEAPVEEDVVLEEVTTEGVSGSYTMNIGNSSFSWLGKKVTGEHSGSISLKDGMFSIENGMLDSGKAVIDLTSIIVEDIEDADMNAKLAGHLNSEDFFNTAEFPTATLEITGADKEKATGTLAIKGITNRVEFPYTISAGTGEVKLSGTIVIDRTMYDIKYGSGKFFDDLGDKTIYDEFELSFSVLGTLN